jgi:hypothetical protein
MAQQVKDFLEVIPAEALTMGVLAAAVLAAAANLDNKLLLRLR